MWRFLSGLRAQWVMLTQQTLLGRDRRGEWWSECLAYVSFIQVSYPFLVFSCLFALLFCKILQNLAKDCSNYFSRLRPLLAVTHSRSHSPRSFWSAPRIKTSGRLQHGKSALHRLIDKSGWLKRQNDYSAHAQKSGPARGLYPWRKPIRSRALGRDWRSFFHPFNSQAPARFSNPFLLHHPSGLCMLTLIFGDV